MRQNECKRNQKDDFSKQCNKKRNLRLAKTEEGTLYAALQSENCHAGNVNRKYLLYDDNQFRVSREKTGKKSRTKHCEYNVDESGSKSNGDHAPDCLADTVKLACTKVVADDRLYTVRKAVDRYENQPDDLTGELSSSRHRGRRRTSVARGS